MTIASQDEFQRIERQMRTVGILIRFIKLVPIIIVALAGIFLTLAAFDIAERNYGWGIVNLVLGLIGIILLAKLIREPLGRK